MNIPRRNRTDLMIPAELAILEATWEVEKVGAHPDLTNVPQLNAVGDLKN